jgi:hypothetical protein
MFECYQRPSQVELPRALGWPILRLCHAPEVGLLLSKQGVGGPVVSNKFGGWRRFPKSVGVRRSGVTNGSSLLPAFGCRKGRTGGGP